MLREGSSAECGCAALSWLLRAALDVLLEEALGWLRNRAEIWDDHCRQEEMSAAVCRWSLLLCSRSRRKSSSTERGRQGPGHRSLWTTLILLAVILHIMGSH